MRLEKCMLTMDELSEGAAGNIKVPSEAFSNIKMPCRFIAFKKQNSNFIKLLSITDPEMRVYEIYAEIENEKLTPFIVGLTKIASRTDEVIFIPEVEGICPGGTDIPCTFDGFILVKGENDIADQVREELANIVDGDTRIVKHIEVERIPE